MSFPPNGHPEKGAHPSCYDYQLKPNFHSPDTQRYVSPTTGKCRKLCVQCTPAAINSPKLGGATHAKEVPVSGGASKTLKLAYWLTVHSPFGEDFLGWVARWLWMILCLFWPVSQATYEKTYNAYHAKFWGQLWAARSQKEYSLRIMELHGRPMEVPVGLNGDSHSITHADYPRQLIIYDGRDWLPCTSPEVLMRTNYVAISYRQSDFLAPRIQPNWGMEDVKREVYRLKMEVSELARLSCLEQGCAAYWLDFECTGESQAEKNVDLYRIADVFRGASKTVILIRNRYIPLTSNISERSLKLRPEERNAEERYGWNSWGNRVWTFPEGLLSKELVYKFGYEDARPISLRQMGNMAYTPDQDEMAIIDGFSGKDTLERIEKLTLLKNAIWKRSSGSSASPQAPKPANTGTGSQFTAYPAERVYALMGFFEHRIMPDPRETPLDALARLCMANDSDRIAERMVAMLPPSIPDHACWYSDYDLFNSKLWDIEPEVQVAGKSRSGALVLDGCRAAPIRWKNFPEVAYALKPTFRRRLCGTIPYTLPHQLLTGLLIISVNGVLGGIITALVLLVLLFAPKLLVYGYSGRIQIARPWLVGVKGFMTAEEVGVALYGCVSSIPHAPTISYAPSGSVLSRPGKSIFRQGDPAQSEYAASHAANVYTLVDTLSNTVYHFTAARAPTVCVYVGREGGLGRYLLCSESCGLNELHKETVLRMPSYISNQMRICDWLAVG